MLPDAVYSAAARAEALSLSTHLESVMRGSMPIALHFQPIVDLAHGTVAGYEALARFPQEIGLAPDRCLAAAGLLGMRPELEDMLARQTMELRSTLPQNTFLAFNLSPSYFVSDKFYNMLSEVGSVGGVVFEITEQDVIADYAQVRRVADKLHSLGGALAVDDTGAGYASLKHVMELRPDFIKLDRLFVDGCHQDPTKRELIELLGETANRLDAWLIAEGVENQAELDELLRLGVPLCQGYFFGYPVEGMGPVEPAKIHLLKERRDAMTDVSTIHSFAEPCVTASTLESAEAILHSSHAETVAVLDRWSRPLHIVHRQKGGDVHLIPNLMRVQIDTFPEEALARALTRTAPGCFDSFAAVTPDGSFAGMVRMDRLMRGVLDAKRPMPGPLAARPVSQTRAMYHSARTPIVH